MNIQSEPKSESRSAERTRNGVSFLPSVDIVENQNALVVLADIPGASGESVDVDFENGELTIRARVEERQESGARYLLREYGTGDFQRAFTVSERIDINRITAEYTNGVLKLTLPKSEAAKPKKISVKSA